MKVCVIYSGQTRSYNNNHELWNSHKRMADELQTRYNIEVDFVGHTWEDQPIPWNITDFKQFNQENQDCIDMWAKDDFFKRAWWAPGSDTFQDFVIDCIDQRKGNELLDKIIHNTRQAYGQIFSFFKCIDELDNTYDAYFKTRWDIMIDKTLGLCEFFPYAIEEKDPLVLFSGNAFINPQHPKDRMNNTATTKTFVGDTNFVINKKAMNAYKDNNWLEYLHWNIVNSRYNDSKPSSHTLWTMMHPDTITGRFVLKGDCFSITRTPDDVNRKKEINKWAI